MPIDRKVRVWLEAEVGSFVRDMGLASAAVKGLVKEVDTTNDRTAWLAQSILALGPALVPLGAAAVPVFTGLLTQMTLTATAAGTTVMAFNGIGDALGAVNKYELEPSVENLSKMHEELAKVGPAGADFVAFLDDLGPKFRDLQMAAREGLFPGVEDGLTSFLDLLPRVRNIVTETAEAMGDLASSAGAGLSGEGFADFFDYLERNTKPLLVEMGQTVGNFAEGLAALIDAFEPLTDRFSAGFLNMSASFAQWAHNLEGSAGFANFVDYVQQSIPPALDLLSSLSDAFVALLAAAAPVGDKMLPALELFFDALAIFLDSPIGPIFLGLAAVVSVYGRAMALASITTGGMGKALAKSVIDVKALKAAFTTARPHVDAFANSLYRAGQGARHQSLYTQATNKQVGGFVKAIGPAVGAAGLFAVAMSDLDDKAGLTNTTMGAMIGMIGGPWGVAIGTGIGLFLDFKNAGDEFEESLRNIDTALDNGISGFGTAREGLAAMREEYLGMVREFNNPGLTTGLSPGYWKEVAENLELTRSSTGGVRLALGEMYGDEIDLINERTQALTDAEDAIMAVGFAFNFDFRRNDNGTFVRDIEELAAVADRAEPAMRALGITWEQIANMDSEGQRAAAQSIKVWADNAETAGGRTLNLAEAFHNLDDDMLSTATSAEALTTALDQLLDPQLNLSEATDAWDEGLRNLDDDLAKHSRSLTANTDAADKNRETIRDRVNRLKDVIAAEAETGASAAELSRKLRQQRRDLVEAGVAAGFSKEELRKYLNELGLTPEIVKTVMAINTEGAMRSLRIARAALLDLTKRQWTAILRIRTEGGRVVGNVTDALPDRTPAGADGMTVPGQRYPYGDKTLIFAAPGERLISNRDGQADRYAAILDAINNNRYADGGIVGRRTIPAVGASGAVTLAGIDYDRLADAMARVRPLYGDVHVSDGYGGFKRQMLQDRQVMAMGGF